MEKAINGGGKGQINGYNPWSKNSNIGAKVASDVTSVDCSGLVWWTLSSLNMQTSGFSFNNNVPVDTLHWLSPDGNYFPQVAVWKYNTTTNEWNVDPSRAWKYNTTTNEWKASESTGVYNTALKVKRGDGAWNDINVLKVNDPIDSNLRYWEYYGSDNVKRELPMGTIIVSYGKGFGKNYNDHAWIYIGNLGTKDEAIAKLNAMGIKCDDSVVKDYGNGCTHWRIESSWTRINGKDVGVTINNGDPDYAKEYFR